MMRHAVVYDTAGADPAKLRHGDLFVMTAGADTDPPLIRAANPSALILRYVHRFQTVARITLAAGADSNGNHTTLTGTLGAEAATLTVASAASAPSSGYAIVRRTPAASGTINIDDFAVCSYAAVDGADLTGVSWGVFGVQPPSAGKSLPATSAVSFATAVGNDAPGAQYDFMPFDAAHAIGEAAFLHMRADPDYRSCRLWWASSARNVEFMLNPQNAEANSAWRENFSAHMAGLDGEIDGVFIDNASLTRYSSGTGLYRYAEFEPAPQSIDGAYETFLRELRLFLADNGWQMWTNVSQGGRRYLEPFRFIDLFDGLMIEGFLVDPFTGAYFPGASASPVLGDAYADDQIAMVSENPSARFVLYQSESVGEAKTDYVLAGMRMMQSDGVFAGVRKTVTGQTSMRAELSTDFGAPEEEPVKVASVADGSLWRRRFERAAVYLNTSASEIGGIAGRTGEIEPRGARRMFWRTTS